MMVDKVRIKVEGDFLGLEFGFDFVDGEKLLNI